MGDDGDRRALGEVLVELCPTERRDPIDVIVDRPLDHRPLGFQSSFRELPIEELVHGPVLRAGQRQQAAAAADFVGAAVVRVAGREEILVAFDIRAKLMRQD